ncbi:MAG: hypothetical protein QXO16_04320 [Archaeoglobaceae archaeon]
MSNDERELLKILSQKEKTLTTLRKSIQTIEKLSINEPSNNLHKINAEVDKIKKMMRQKTLDDFVTKEVEAYIQTKEAQISQWKEEAKKTLGLRLKEAFEKYNFEWRGTLPNIRIKFYRLHFDLDNNKVDVWYGPEQERLFSMQLLPEKIAKKLHDIDTQITKKRFEDRTFLFYLWKAYKLAVCSNNQNIGDPVKISNVLLYFAVLSQNKKFQIDPIKTNYSDYGRIFFSYDLYRLKERRLEGENMELELKIATRAYTERREDFLWIPSNEEGDGNYFSHVVFRRC